MTRQQEERNDNFEEMDDIADLFDSKSTTTTGQEEGSNNNSKKTNFSSTSSMEMVRKFVLNAPSLSKDIQPFEKNLRSSTRSSSLAIQTSSVSTFPLSGLGSMSSLFGSSTEPHGEGDSTENNSPPKQSRIQDLKALMDSKMPAVSSSRVLDSKKPAAAPSFVQQIRAPAPGSAINVEPATSSMATSVFKRRTEPSPREEDYITDTPNDNDVLMGRGGRSNQHPGNARYLQEKIRIQPRYRAASKDAKKEISQELVDAVAAWGGRFLKLDENRQRWYIVDNRTARVKASQALREDNTEESRRAKRNRYLKKRKSPP